MRGVTIIDYGVGNLLSVARAMTHCGGQVTLTSDPRQVAGADRLVLPGVGAFAKGMAGLKQRGLLEALNNFTRHGRPFLGICLGMQMMLEESDEFGQHPGLGWIPGRVEAIPATAADGQPHTIPHMGWNALHPPEEQPGAWQATPLAEVQPGFCAYFVHSFAARPANPEHHLAQCDYHGRSLCAAVRRDALFGFQFHPEKSGPGGLAMIQSFLTL